MSTHLDQTSAETDTDVSDGGVLSLTGSVGDHDAPAVGLGEESGVDGLCWYGKENE